MVSLVALLVALSAAVASAVLIATSLPLLQRHAVAQPNSRSSHRIPTPQGGGAGLIIACLLASGLGAVMLGADPPIAAVFGATVTLAVSGLVDDIKPIPVLPRLLIQTAAVLLMLIALPVEARLTSLPYWFERAALVLACLWFVNAVNFMDGIDWMSVAEVVPVSAALTLMGIAGFLSGSATLVAAGLCGAYCGFAPFNRPTAKIFLGDAGSLPTGILLAWCLIDLARHGGGTAALILPLYYLCDTGWTLAARLLRRERIWVAHRSHFYQRAVDRGHSVMRTVCTVFGLNVILAGLAALALHSPVLVQAASVLIAVGAVSLVAAVFQRPPNSQTAL